jgi:hypothetical protein
MGGSHKETIGWFLVAGSVGLQPHGNTNLVLAWRRGGGGVEFHMKTFLCDKYVYFENKI